MLRSIFQRPMTVTMPTANQVALNILSSWALNRERESNGANRSPLIDSLALLSGASHPDGASYCARAVCVSMRLAGDATRSKPLIETSGSCARLWLKNPSLQIQVSEIRNGTMNIEPGDIFIRTRESRDLAKLQEGKVVLGHTGLVKSYNPTTRLLVTVEANTNGDDDSADGGGFYEKTLSIDDPRLIGFLRVKFRSF